MLLEVECGRPNPDFELYLDLFKSFNWFLFTKLEPVIPNAHLKISFRLHAYLATHAINYYLSTLFYFESHIEQLTALTPALFHHESSTALARSLTV